MSALDTTSFNSPLGYNSPSFGTIPQQDFGKAINLVDFVILAHFCHLLNQQQSIGDIAT
mgnify:CR=1 FL=1